jgi:hypothetical protein
MTSKELIEKYPKIFRTDETTRLESFSMFGMECGSGWYNLIDTLCFQIQDHIDWRIKSNELIERNKKKYPDYNQTPCELIPQVRVTQVKEKFGTLRFYYDGGDELISGLVTMAEAMSSRICETCGNPGKIRGRSWFYTACDEHTLEEDKDE